MTQGTEKRGNTLTASIAQNKTPQSVGRGRSPKVTSRFVHSTPSITPATVGP